MRSKSAAFPRYRPRMLTLPMIAATSALLVLANLSDDVLRRGGDARVAIANLRFDVSESADGEPVFGFWNMSYGWPLRWHQYVHALTPGPSGVIAWRYSAIRLVGNVAMWLIMLAAPAAACEGLLRRFRPRFRWSLRSMMVAVGVVAVLFGWFAVARERAIVQDPLIARHPYIWLEQRGPKWLDLVGADRYFRTVIGANLFTSAIDARHDAQVEESLKQLKRLPKLQYLFVEIEHLTPHMAATLGDALVDAPQLRVLSIELSSSVSHTEEEWMSSECLASVGQLSQLEHLHLERMRLAGDSLACLAGLVNLKTLSMEDVSPSVDHRAPEAHLLKGMPALPRLEALDLRGSEIDDHDLRQLAVLPRLKSLNLSYTNVASAGPSELAHLDSLEELTIDSNAVSAKGIESLQALKRLKTLHIYQDYRPRGQVSLALETVVPPDEREDFLRALRDLRQSKPGIVIDGDGDALHWPGQRIIPSCYKTIHDLQHPWAHKFLDDWKVGNGELQRR